MKLHEYQSRDVLASFGVAVPGGDVAVNPADAKRIADLYGGKVVVKAQVLMGGRGKAGGVKAFDDAKEAEEFARDLIGRRLVSVQNPAGMVVEKVLVVEKLDIRDEYYLSVLVDRSEQRDLVMLSARGGMEIEQVAEESPEAIVKLHVDPKWGLSDYEIRDAVRRSGIDPAAAGQMASMVRSVYEAYKAVDATLVEINPCAFTAGGKLVAADAKVAIDDSALFRQSQFAATCDESFDDPIEAQAARRGISYVKLGGTVGVMGNGAGLVMLTLDEVARAGQKAANFLDVGGGAQADRVRSCVELVLMDPDVRALLINIFGGITRGDEVARGVAAAIRELEVEVPIVVRIEGTNAEAAREILASANLIPAATVQEAAAKVNALLTA